MNEKEIRVKIFRYEKKGNKKAKYDEYTVPIEPLMTILDVLDFIYENLDSTISYNSNCRRGTCAVCTVLVNGKTAKSCVMKASEDITIEPVSKEKCIKDLVVENL
jgi:succinate dehydrogenase/fumarate reductase-like Fe-S protein